MSKHEYAVVGHKRSTSGMIIAFLAGFISSIMMAGAERLLRVAQDAGYFDFPSIVLWPDTGVAVYSVIFFLFYRYGWRTKIVRSIVNIPNISGKWSVEGIPSVRSQGSKENWKGEIEIEQDYEKIYIILRTEQSQSQSNSASLVPEGPRYRLIYSYRNDPQTT